MVQSIHAVLRNALESAVREEVIPRNVAKLVKVTTPKYAVNRGLSAVQARQVLKAAKGERLYALYVLALCLGLRRGELLGLRWQDADLDVGTLEVVQTLQRVGGALRFVRPKTCVSLLLHLGVPPDMVREIVGHSDIEVTMTIYAHTSLDEKRRALGKLGDALA